MAICKSQNGKSDNEMYGMAAGNKATWGMGMRGIRLRMWRMQEVKVRMGEMESGCSESMWIRANQNCVGKWVKM